MEKSANTSQDSVENVSKVTGKPRNEWDAIFGKSKESFEFSENLRELEAVKAENQLLKQTNTLLTEKLKLLRTAYEKQITEAKKENVQLKHKYEEENMLLKHKYEKENMQLKHKCESYIIELKELHDD